MGEGDTVEFTNFTLPHFLPILLAVAIIVLTYRFRDRLRTAYVCLVALAGIAYGANRLIGPGANYLFMARPEDTPSILDILPPNFALRLLIMATAVTLLFGLAYLPWHLLDKKNKNTPKRGEIV